MDYAELWRPQYHYSTLDSKTNDPNGLVYYKGVYHLYYQNKPHQQTVRQHWGHATSTDLVHWTEQEVVLFPDDLGNIWSGTGVVDIHNTSGFFTDTEEKSGIVVAYSTHTQHVGIAYSKDGGMTFQKVSTTEPVLANPGIRAFRDPHIFWHPETNKWKMVVAGHGGAFWIYEADDLVHWEFCSVNYEIYTECPNLLKMRVENTSEYKWILSCVGRRFYVGSFDGRVFVPETDEIVFHEGPDSYAGITFSNMPDGRTVMINWLFDQDNWQDCEPYVEKKWNGAYSVPLELKLVKFGDSYKLLQMPVQELDTLQAACLVSVKDRVCCCGENPLADVHSNCFVLDTQIDLNRSGAFSIRVCEGDGDSTSLSFDPSSRCMTVDGRQSQFGSQEKRRSNLYSFFVDPLSVKDGRMKIRLLVDVSYIELFINDGHYYFAMQIQPAPASRDMSLVFEKQIAIDRLSVHEYRSIWFDSYPKNTVIRFPEMCSQSTLMAEGTCWDVQNISPIFLSAGKVVAVKGNNLYMQKISSGNAVTIMESVANFTVSTRVIAHGEGVADVIFRAADACNFICLSLDFATKTVRLWKNEQGQPVILCEQSHDLCINQAVNVRLDANAAVIQVFVDNAMPLITVDQTFRTGKLCLNNRTADMEFNHFCYWLAQ